MEDTLLLTTYKGAFLLRVGSKKYSCVHKCKGNRSFGITWNNYKLFIADISGISSSISVYNTNFSSISLIPSVSSNTHQILYYKNNIWCTSANNAFISRFKCFDYSVLGRWKPIKNGKHLNSIFVCRNILYLLYHNKGNPSFILKLKYKENSSIIPRPFSHTTDYIYENVGNYSHNVWVENDELFVCDSLGGRIKEVISDKVVVETGGFPRGVVITDTYNYIAVSDCVISRDKRAHSDGKICVYDKEWNLVNECPMVGFGLLQDLRIISVRDYAHYSGSELVDFNLNSIEWEDL